VEKRSKESISLLPGVIGDALHRVWHRGHEHRRSDGWTVAALDLASVLVRDDEDHIVRWNTGCTRLYGYTAEEALGRVSHALLQTRFPEPLEAIRARLRESGRWQGELLHTARDGRQLVVHSEWIRGDGVITEVNSDMTARKEAETARDVLVSIFANSEDAIYTKDLKGQLTNWNPGAERLFGYTAAQVLGKNVLLLIPPERYDEEERILAAVQRGESLEHYESQRKARDGRLIEVSLTTSPVRDAAGAIIGAATIARDITRRKAAEDSLRESEERFRTLADNISQLAWMADAEGNTVWYNRRWFEYTGTTPEQVKGWGWKSVHHPDHLERVVENLTRCYETGQPWEDTFPLRGRDGQYRWFLSRAIPIRNEHGTVTRWFGTNTDITELREAQQALARNTADLERSVTERTARLQEMVAELENFSYTITHDMRAPLRAMRGLADLLVEECAPGLQGERLEYLRRIADSAERMDQLITDALQYSLLVRKQYKLEPVDADALLHGILESYPRFQPPHANIEVAHRLPVVLGNKAGLTQCFSNLLGNAVKFVRPGQTPEVSVRAEPGTDGHRDPAPAPAPGSAASPLSAWHVPAQTAADAGPAPREPSPSVRIVFEDKGIGIDREYHDKIWVMFQRLNKTYAGTGIGLALVRKAVERMGGRVGVESEPGRGSRFWVELQKVNGK